MRQKGLVAALGLLGVPLMLASVFADAARTRSDDYTFGLEQYVGVVIGCTAVWLACVWMSGWRPRNPIFGRAVSTTPAVRGRARATGSRQLWLDLSHTRVVRALGALQAAVIGTTTICLVAFTSTGWLVALVAGFALSLVINLALSRFSHAEVRRQRGSRS